MKDTKQTYKKTIRDVLSLMQNLTLIKIIKKNIHIHVKLTLLKK